jgi:hypothetical protein
MNECDSLNFRIGKVSPILYLTDMAESLQFMLIFRESKTWAVEGNHMNNTPVIDESNV